MLLRIHGAPSPVPGATVPPVEGTNANDDTASSRKTSGPNSISVASLSHNNDTPVSGNVSSRAAPTSATGAAIDDSGSKIPSSDTNTARATASARPLSLAPLPFDKHGINVDNAGPAYIGIASGATKSMGAGAGGSQRSSLIAGLFDSLGGVLEDSTHPSPQQRRLVPPNNTTDWNLSYQSSAVNRSIHPTSLLRGPTQSDFSALWHGNNPPLLVHSVRSQQQNDSEKKPPLTGSIPSSPRKSSSNLLSLGLVSPSTQPLGIASPSQSHLPAPPAASVQVQAPVSPLPPVSLPIPPPPLPAASSGTNLHNVAHSNNANANININSNNITPQLPANSPNVNVNVNNNPIHHPQTQLQQQHIQHNQQQPGSTQYMGSPNFSSSTAAPMLGLAAARSNVLPFVMASGMFDYGLGSVHQGGAAGGTPHGAAGGMVQIPPHPIGTSHMGGEKLPQYARNQIPVSVSGTGFLYGHANAPASQQQINTPQHSMMAAANTLAPSSIALPSTNVIPLNAVGVPRTHNNHSNGFPNVAATAVSAELPVTTQNALAGIPMSAALADDTRSTMSLDPIPPRSLVTNSVAQKEEPLFALVVNNNNSNSGGEIRRPRKRPRTNSNSNNINSNNEIGDNGRDLLGNVDNGNDKEQCPLCSEKFRSRIILQTHLRVVHKSGSEHRCAECNAEFPWKSTLDNHVRLVHRKERPFKCNRCEKAFRWSSHLEEHIWVVHEGRKPFKCEICDKAFGRKNNMQKHARKVHKLDNAR